MMRPCGSLTVSGLSGVRAISGGDSALFFHLQCSAEFHLSLMSKRSATPCCDLGLGRRRLHGLDPDAV